MVRVKQSTETRPLNQLLDRCAGPDKGIERRVSRIISDVRARGDEALVEYARRLDDLDGSLDVSAGEMRKSAATVPAEVRRAVALAARNIRKGEELSYDYSTDGEGSVQCKCRPGCKTIF